MDLADVLLVLHCVFTPWLQPWQVPLLHTLMSASFLRHDTDEALGACTLDWFTMQSWRLLEEKHVKCIQTRHCILLFLHALSLGCLFVQTSIGDVWWFLAFCVTCHSLPLDILDLRSRGGSAVQRREGSCSTGLGWGMHGAGTFGQWWALDLGNLGWVFEADCGRCPIST